jgi:hypothetical protein
MNEFLYVSFLLLFYLSLCFPSFFISLRLLHCLFPHLICIVPFLCALLSVFTFPSVCSAIFTPAASALIHSSWCTSMAASRRDLSLHSRCPVPLPQSNRLPSAWGHVHACTQRKLIPASHCSICYRRLSHRKLEHNGVRQSRSQEFTGS